MAEEKDSFPTTNSDDVHALRILLHAIRGLNTVSTTPAFVVDESEHNQ